MRSCVFARAPVALCVDTLVSYFMAQGSARVEREIRAGGRAVIEAHVAEWPRAEESAQRSCEYAFAPRAPGWTIIHVERGDVLRVGDSLARMLGVRTLALLGRTGRQWSFWSYDGQRSPVERLVRSASILRSEGEWRTNQKGEPLPGEPALPAHEDAAPDFLREVALAAGVDLASGDLADDWHLVRDSVPEAGKPDAGNRGQ